MPKKAAIHIQNTAPGPPIQMAADTPAMLPVPIVVRYLKELCHKGQKDARANEKDEAYLHPYDRVYCVIYLGDLFQKLFHVILASGMDFLFAKIINETNEVFKTSFSSPTCA